MKDASALGNGILGVGREMPEKSKELCNPCLTAGLSF